MFIFKKNIHGFKFYMKTVNISKYVCCVICNYAYDLSIYITSQKVPIAIHIGKSPSILWTVDIGINNVMMCCSFRFVYKRSLCSLVCD